MWDRAISDRIPIFKGRIVDLGIETVQLPNGRTVELEVMRHPGAAAILPLHEDGSVTLVFQFRHAGGGMHYEVPAGILEDMEIPDLAARRELAEETGLKAGKLKRLGVIHTTPGFTDERIYLFLATELTEGPASPEWDEYLKPVRMPLEQALGMIDEGDITDAKTICALTMAARALAAAG
jgi:ADP-ribose pyrophosphatase